MNVALIGASSKPERYSYKALKMLEQKRHRVFPVHHRIKDIEGRKVYASLIEIPEVFHTATFYVNADISSLLQEDILRVRPARIIFNPGAENPELVLAAKAVGIDCLNACTLVLLTTGQF